MAYLSLKHLKKRYEGKQVLHGVDIDIAHRAFVVIVGPSGCGKSTLLRMIAGLEEVTEGSIALDGREIAGLDSADRGCAMVFQNYALYPHMTVRENIGYPLKLAGMSRDERARKVQEAARILDLGDYLDRRPAQLSGGQRQRVAMGRAIVREPKLFLFDEPLSNLDAKLRVTMRIEIKRLHRRLDATSIFVTHDQVEAMTLADLLVVMNAGRVEQIGTPTEIYGRPASTFVAGFLGAPAMNLIPAQAIDGRVRLDGAAEIAFDLVAAARGRVTLGIRPEDIELSPQGIPVKVDLIEELGGSRIAYAVLAGQEISIVLPRGATAMAGDILRIELPAAALHLFDGDTGRRIEWSAPQALVA
jgi:sn-glycerol 3-phosphate transport system ATP-binding protein